MARQSTKQAQAAAIANPRPVRVIEDWSRVVRPVDLFTEDGFADYARRLR
ncbi:hypothetical protein VZG28_04965 [Synechococcus elongatus IITB4]